MDRELSMTRSQMLESSHVTVRFDYLARFQAEMARVLPTRSRREKDAFTALELNQQTWRFMNWQSRLVHPHPRQVNKAAAFDSLPAVQANRTSIEALLAGIARGDDVTEHLSKDIEQGYCLHPTGRKDGPDFDLLLNEWGIHHLHIDQAPGKGGFTARSNELLYVIFGRGVAFVLAVALHGEWTSRSLIEAAVQSWPNQKLFVALNGFQGRGWNEGEHKVLRKTGGMTATVVNGRSWVSGVTCGMSTALVSGRIVRESGELLRSLHQASERPEHLKRQLMDNAAVNGVVWPAEPTINVRWLTGPDCYCFGFVEEKCGATALIETQGISTKIRA